jgi:phage terminase large subunit-like protein
MKDNMFKVFTYPGILPNKELLAPDRFTFEYLMELKQSLGSIVFAREILVSPISDSSSLFPYEYLRNAFIGMENISYVDDIDSFPIKMERVVVGCDFAISGKIGADYTVYTVWGRDHQKNFYLMHMWRKRGASHGEQISQIISIDNRFKPNKIICESNGFQSMLSDMVRQRGLRNIEEFTTTSNVKRDLYTGLPSLSALFERGSIKMPYKDRPEDRSATDLVCGEFNSISFNEDSGKLESVDQNDDTVMSCFFAINELREKDHRLELFLI